MLMIRQTELSDNILVNKIKKVPHKRIVNIHLVKNKFIKKNRA